MTPASTALARAILDVALLGVQRMRRCDACGARVVVASEVCNYCGVEDGSEAVALFYRLGSPDEQPGDINRLHALCSETA